MPRYVRVLDPYLLPKPNHQTESFIFKLTKTRRPADEVLG